MLVSFIITLIVLLISVYLYRKYSSLLFHYIKEGNSDKLVSTFVNKSMISFTLSVLAAVSLVTMFFIEDRDLNNIRSINKELVIEKDSLLKLTEPDKELAELGFLEKSELLVESIAEVETKNNPEVISKTGKFVGYLQMSKIVVDEANSILGTNKYSYGDRLDMEKSKEIFFVIQNKWNPKLDIDKAIGLWGFGPGYNFHNPDHKIYHDKVMKAYHKRIDKRLTEILREYKSISLN